MLDLKTERNSDEVKLTINGNLTVENADAFLKSLIEVMEDSTFIVLSFEDITGADMSCLQLLCSAHRTAVARNKKFSLKGQLPEVLKVVAESAEYFQCKSCKDGISDDCYWVSHNC